MKLDGSMPMYYGAKPELFEFAKRMRYSPTEAEKALWKILTSPEFRPYKFRRQHPISRAIADFYSHSLQLVIEADGGYHLKHSQVELDEIRDVEMQELGLVVLRFTNNEIISCPDAVRSKIQTFITQRQASIT